MNPHYKEKYDAIKSHVGGLIDVKISQQTTQRWRHALLLSVDELCGSQIKVKVRIFWQGNIFDINVRPQDVHIL